MVKNLPAMRETWVWSLGREEPLEKGITAHFSILAGESHGQKSLVGYSHKELWLGVTKSWTRLSDFHIKIPASFAITDCIRSMYFTQSFFLNLTKKRERNGSFWNSLLWFLALTSNVLFVWCFCLYTNLLPYTTSLSFCFGNFRSYRQLKRIVCEYPYALPLCPSPIVNMLPSFLYFFLCIPLWKKFLMQHLNICCKNLNTSPLQTLGYTFKTEGHSSTKL